MAPHSSTLAWKIPWMEEPGRLQSMRSHRVGHDWSDLAVNNEASFVAQMVKNSPPMKETWVQPLGWDLHKIPCRRAWEPTPVFLPKEFYGHSLVGYSPWDHRIRHDWTTFTVNSECVCLHFVCPFWININLNPMLAIFF